MALLCKRHQMTSQRLPCSEPLISRCWSRALQANSSWGYGSLCFPRRGVEGGSAFLCQAGQQDPGCCRAFPAWPDPALKGAKSWKDTCWVLRTSQDSFSDHTASGGTAQVNKELVPTHTQGQCPHSPAVSFGDRAWPNPGKALRCWEGVQGRVVKDQV